MPRVYDAVQGQARCARRLRRPWTASRPVESSLDGECRGSRPRQRAVVREHPIWSTWGCANSETNRMSALCGILTEQLFPAKGWCVTATAREAGHVVVDLAPVRASA